MLPTTPRALHVIAYHYVRDLSRTAFPRLHAFSADQFRAQVGELQAVYEMATVESALAFAVGRYEPARDLCLLTFDDGLRDHFDEVFPALHERRIQGVFFLITECLEGQLATVHQSHFLMAHLGFDEYRRRVLASLATMGHPPIAINGARARATYRWDVEAVAHFKYLLNFVLATDVREVVIADVFGSALGDRTAFARALYLDWSEAATMQANGMAVGGHTHTHRPLSHLSAAEKRHELRTSTTMMRQKLPGQALWPFSFPYGKLDSFDADAVGALRDLGYDCAFTTVPGPNHPGVDLFALRRIDPKEVAIEHRALAPSQEAR